ncbi:hypothetical protein [Micromonospora sp. KC723]|uniref:hypothetical protein n=1 Tax=Micromonospora sp. KC723 TaxID=2530381 RepID=UPI001053384F|nr:hypothetical protein [Micromonospora sp. KC723]TDB71769.1 hypothetical protein E1165_22075 [Micromonospora sp. KC723]
MTAPTDLTFVARVRAALAGQVRSILAEAEGNGWRDLQHRQLAERIKALVAATHPVNDPTGTWGGVDLLGPARRLAVRLAELQGPSGLFTGGDNVDSPPDSAFSVNDLADALLLLRRAGTPTADHRALTEALERLLAATVPALTGGGVHTPNHRWEISAALARLFLVSPAPELAARVRQWLAEGVDVDDDGLYSERSANYAAHVSNPSLLVIAEVFDRPDLVDVVERNLDATVDLLLPDGSVETVMSRRQDQNQPIPLAVYLLALRRVALLRGRGDLAWAAGLALEQGITAPADAAARLVLDPDIARVLPAPVNPRRPRQRVFGAAGLLVEHASASTTVLFGGSDYAQQGRIRSGLANSPTFLRLFAGAAVLDSVRLSRTFFGKGPFRADGLRVERGPTGETTVTLAETVTAAYYQPLAQRDRDPRGDYRLGDEGRFSAAMDFDRRVRDDVTLHTTVGARLTATGVELTFDLTGAVVDWALELAFRPGGTLSGARRLGERGWQLDATAGAAAAPVAVSYRCGDDVIRVELVEASDGQGNPLPAASSAPVYEPGEEYRFLGGTDAAAGERLYVTGRVPARVRMLLTVDMVP